MKNLFTVAVSTFLILVFLFDVAFIREKDAKVPEGELY